MQTTEKPVRLAGRTLRENRHICAFFHSKAEQDAVLMPFFKEGLERGEKVFNIVDPLLKEEYIGRMEQHGIPARENLKRGQIEVRVWEEAYLRDGYFDSERMVRVLTEVLTENRQQYGLTRLMGNMEWALQTLPGVTDIVEYETKLNYVLCDFPDPVVCAYDLNRHSASVVMDILRTHPMVIVGGILQENPLYVPPDEFLAELKSRRKHAGPPAH